MSADWPLFGLSIRTPRLELRVPTDEEYGAICDIAAAGVHDPRHMPFAVEWTDRPTPLMRREAFQFMWRTRAEWTPDSWHLEFAVYHEGRPIGMKGLWAQDFPSLREFATGSWLGLGYQGHGFGKEMRAAVLHFAFRHLHGQWAVSQTFDDNPASISVNLFHGYEPDGFEMRARRGVPARWLRFRLAAEKWDQRDMDIEVDGLADCRDMFR